ncbi:hypothetical protein [Microscilla marina]|uniref:DUF5020 domain-containing protein n=1 Tax=Microscilla marina ATCC 23134 TaxID=313606 RepID=A1ZQ88_MICM2|nr:hypothetical protein [Microscilla marina]EAY27497.1 conserved hypothetical protein [Microscilla marina ATCC 23134]
MMKKKLRIALLILWFMPGMMSNDLSFAQVNVSHTGAQLSYGTRFDDITTGLNTQNGQMLTFIIDNFSTWPYGDNFFFVNFFSGQFLDANNQPTGNNYSLYAEWQPRISLKKIFSGGGEDPKKRYRIKNRQAISYNNAFGVDDILLAGQINQGENYHARMIGLSVNFRVPLFNVFFINGYYRYDNSDFKTYQITGVWGLPIRISNRLEFSFQGYFDMFQSQNDGFDILTQPNIAWKVSKLFSEDPQNTFKIGVEWFYHRNSTWTTSTPQFFVRWAW